MIKKIFLATFLVASLFALTAKEFKQQQTQGFKTYKENQEEEFKKYQQKQQNAFKRYKKELGIVWEEPKLSTKKELVSYSKDKRTRTNIDFEEETITVEAIAVSPKEANQKLQIALAKAITIDTKTLQESDPLEKILTNIKKPSNVVDAKVKAEPILSTVIFDKSPTIKSVKKYINIRITPIKIKITHSKKIKHANIYSIKVKLPKDTMIKRSKIYYSEVKKQANRQKYLYH